MDGCSNKDEEACPQLLDLIAKDREWLVQRGEPRSHESSEEKKLELRLGPPGEDWTSQEGTKNREDSILSLGYFSNMASLAHNTSHNFCNNVNQNNTNTTSGAKRGFTNTVDMKTVENGWIMNKNGSQNQKFPFSENPVGTALSSPWPSSVPPFIQLQSNPQSMAIKAKESSQPCGTKAVDLQNGEKKAFLPAPANTAVPNSSQKRTAPAPVVGWPPIRSFRKNLASSSSSKPIPESQNVVPDKVLRDKPAESCQKGFFVKINMDGVPIGRKVDLKAYDSYENLSSAVDELFRGLLAAQRDSSAGGIQNKQEREKVITGLLDGSGEYTLVYEDHEGDRMLVGDVPWHMFVSTVKRLRVLKSSELSTLCFGSKQGKIPLDAASK